MKGLSIILLVAFACSGLNAQSEDKSHLNDLFNMSFEELMNVEITTAGKKPEKIGEIPASVVVLGRQEIRDHGFVSLEEILETIPGLYAINDFAFNDVVFGVRGFWSSSAKQILILVNGVRQTEAYASSYVIRNIAVPVEAIDSIEVVRGPNSVLYGSGAFFAAINIITNNSAGESPSIVSSGFGSRGMNKVFLRKAGSGADFSYALNASFLGSDGMDVPYVRFTDTSIPGVPSTTRGQLENEEKYFNFSGASDGWSVDFTLLENPREQFFFGPSEDEGYLNRVTRGSFSVGYDSEVSAEISYAGRFNYIKQVSQTRGDYPPGFSSVEEFYGQENIDTEFIEFEANGFFDPSESLDVTVGINFHSIRHVLDQANLPTFGIPFIPTSLEKGESIDTLALFSQATYSPTENLKLVAGVRLEEQSDINILFESYNAIDGDISIGTISSNVRSFESDGIEVIPRISLIYTTDFKHTVKLLYGEAVIRPSFSQLQFSPANRPTLVPEYISTYEINYVAPLAKDTTINLSVFHNELRDLIVRTDVRLSDGSFTNFSSNSGKQITDGLEFAARTLFYEKLLLDFSITYQESKDERAGFGDIDVAYSPNLLAQFKGTYRFDDFTVALSGNYVDEMETLFVGIPGDGGRREGPTADSHFVVNVNFRVGDLFGTGMYANLRVSNVLDEEYSYPAASFNSWADKGLPGDERQIVFTVGKEF